MKIATCEIMGISPYSQSKHYSKEMVPKLQGENDRDYESRTWRNRLHVNDDGKIFIPPMAFKNCISDCAKFLSLPIPGKGKSTYTKNLQAGILVVEPIPLPIKRDDCESEVLFVPSDGRPGGGSRVEKCFPVIRTWGGHLQILVFDETVLNAYDSAKTTVLEHVLKQAGLFIGIGRFRPRNNGFYGRFEIKKFAVSQS